MLWNVAQGLLRKLKTQWPDPRDLPRELSPQAWTTCSTAAPPARGSPGAHRTVSGQQDVARPHDGTLSSHREQGSTGAGHTWVNAKPIHP